MCAAQRKGERAQALMQKAVLMSNQRLDLTEEQSELEQDRNKTNAGSNFSTHPAHGPMSNQEKSKSSMSDHGDDVHTLQGTIGNLLSIDVCSDSAGANAIEVHRAMPCPKQCPYSHVLSEDPCKKTCVAHCASGNSHTLEGVCASDAKPARWWINVLIVSASLVITAYLVSVTSRTQSKSTRVQLSLEYELQPDSCSSSLELHEAVSGIGTILYLRWLIFLLAMAALCFSVSYASLKFPLHSQRTAGILGLESMGCPPWPPLVAGNKSTGLAEMKASVTQGSVGPTGLEIPKDNLEPVMGSKAPDDDAASARIDEDHNTRVFHGIALSYLLVVVCSLVFSALQIQKACEWIQSNPTHKNFAVLVSGLPSEITEPERLKALFQDVLDFHQALTGGSYSGCTQNDEIPRVIGVSIAYEYQKSQQLVNSVIDAWHEELADDKTQSVFGEPTFPSHFCRALWAERSDAQVLAKSLADLETEVRTIVPNLAGSGHSIVVLSSEAAVRMLITGINTKVQCRSSAFLDLKRLKATAMNCEPLDVSWDFFDHETSTCCAWLCSALVALTVMGMWFVVYCKYLPSALFSGHLPFFTRIPGGSSWIFKDICLSFLIAIGNACIMSTLQRLCKCLKFSDHEYQDIIVLSIGFLATSFNAFGDIFVLLTGMQLFGSTWKFEAAIVQEVLAFVLPGYLILPHVARLISRNVLPFWLSCASPEFSISRRYAELLTNFSVALGMLIFGSTDSWKVSVSLMIFLGLMYATDISRLLSSDRRKFYSSTRLSDMFALWWSVPTGCLGAVAIWWAAKSGNLHLEHLGFPQEIICAAWIPCHVMAYVILLACVRRCFRGPNLSKWKHEDATATLSKRGIAWDYFNTNPVFCLRSRFLHAQPCVPYARAKQSKIAKPPKVSEDL